MAWIRKRPGRVKPYEARWRDPDGKERSRSFARKLDAQRFLATVEADKVRGSYVDPSAGKVSLQAFAESWLAMQTTDPATVEAVASRLRVHVYPHLGSYELRAIRPSVLQGWLAQLQTTLASRYVRVILANVSAILGAAVEDGVLAKNPAASKSVRAPRIDAERVVPWTTARVESVTASHPQRWRAVPTVTGGCGLRQGEVFGLAVDDLDFLGRRLLVRRQVKLLHGRPILAPPKGGRTREVPLPDVVSCALAERLRQHPARPVRSPGKTSTVSRSRCRSCSPRGKAGRSSGATTTFTYGSRRSWPQRWSPRAPTACMRCATTTRACCSMKGCPSGRWPTTWATMIPASRCASTRT